MRKAFGLGMPGLVKSGGAGIRLRRVRKRRRESEQRMSALTKVARWGEQPCPVRRVELEGRKPQGEASCAGARKGGR